MITTQKICEAQLEVLEAVKCILTDYPEISPLDYINGVESKIRETAAAS